jgi:hypothetical protein
MPHREVQAHVEKMYGRARLVESVRHPATGEPVFVFEVRTTSGLRMVRGWRSASSIVTEMPAERSAIGDRTHST